MILGIDASQANREIRSGTEWYAFYLIREFKKLLGGREDIRVRLYLRDLPQADLANNLPENFGFKVLKWPLKYFWGQIRLSWEMLVNPPDILFCPAHTIPLVHPKKTFTTLHDVGFEDHPELYDKLSLWYHRWSAKLAVRSAYHIFTVSEFSRKRIIEVYDCPPERISVTHLGCDLSPDLSPRLGRGALSGNYILFLGRLEPKKNILRMVKGYEKVLRQVQDKSGVPDLVLAGKKIRIEEVEEYLESRPALRNKIKFPGYIAEEDKPALYGGALIFLFPTFYEGFGIPILEAQAAGVPVITSNAASNPEVAGDGAILVNPHHPAEIAAAMTRLLSDERLRNELVKKGLENIKRFDWRVTASKTLKRIFDLSPDLSPRLGRGG